MWILFTSLSRHKIKVARRNSATNGAQIASGWFGGSLAWRDHTGASKHHSRQKYYIFCRHVACHARKCVSVSHAMLLRFPTSPLAPLHALHAQPWLFIRMVISRNVKYIQMTWTCPCNNHVVGDPDDGWWSSSFWLPCRLQQGSKQGVCRRQLLRNTILYIYACGRICFHNAWPTHQELSTSTA
jgi:hypothetical protein